MSNRPEVHRPGGVVLQPATELSHYSYLIFLCLYYFTNFLFSSLIDTSVYLLIM
jgi:hypothetical protein